MAYSDICTVYCKHFGTPQCPTSSKCMALKSKPYFKVKTVKSWYDRWKHKRNKKRICKANNYFCPDCIYHDFHFEGATFRGVSCRLEVNSDGD